MIVESPSPAELPRSDAGRDMPPRLLLADVRRDMTNIFGDPGPAVRTTMPRTREIAVAGAMPPPVGPVRRRASKVPLLATAIAGLLIGMAAMGGLHLADLRERIAPLATTAPATGVSENPFETPMAAPAPPTATAMPRSPVAAAKPAGADQPSVKPAPTQAVEATEPKPAPTEPAAQPDEAPQAAKTCEGDRLERAWCMRHDILEADRRLRGAYAEAIRQGVERKFLVAHQRRWTRLRNLAAQDPNGVLEGYAELAGDLERLSVHGRAANRIR